MIRACITGATGFLGRSLAAALVAGGGQVRALVRPTASLAGLPGRGLETVTGDLEDRDSLQRAVDGQEIVFHCAARVAQWGDRDGFYRVNVDGTRRLLEACLAAGVRRFIHVSSVTVMGIPRSAAPMDESAPYTDRYFEHYTETKIAAEKLVGDFCAARGLPAVIVRPGLIWGAGDTTILPHLEKLARRRLLVHIGGGRNALCLAHVDNVVDALVRAATVPRAAGQAYIITDGEAITSREFFTALTRVLGLRPPAWSVPFRLLYGLAWLSELAAAVLPGIGEPPLTRYGLCLLGTDCHYSIARARRELGYAPPVSFSQGLEGLARWYADRSHPR
jgi:nucleoside-diphosphate-sugar epimerase